MLQGFLPSIFLIIFISLMDFIRIIRCKISSYLVVTKNTAKNFDYTILVPIFGKISYLKNVKFLNKYRKHVILCTTTKETDEFNRSLLKIAKSNGFRIFRSNVVKASSSSTPNPWKVFKKTLSVAKIKKEIARDEIMKDSFMTVDTKYCIFLDGDTIAKKSLSRLVGLMEEKEIDIASVRILASKKESLIEKLQYLEYKLSMDARKVYPWMISGAASVAKTEVMQKIMNQHSLFFSGGDIEIGKISQMLKFRIGHIAFKFYTDVPETFKAWWRQRLIWYGGGFRLSVVNMHQHSWEYPFFFIYVTVMVYLLLPIKLYESIKYPETLGLLIILYWIFIYAFNWRNKKWYYLYFPFYALLQTLILVPLGAIQYLKMVWHSKNWGFIKYRHPNHKHQVLYNPFYIKTLSGFCIVGIFVYLVSVYTILRIGIDNQTVDDNRFIPQQGTVAGISTQNTISDINVSAKDKNDNQAKNEINKASINIPNKIPSQNITFAIMKNKGDTLYLICRKAVLKYEKYTNITLTNSERLFTEDKLAKMYKDTKLEQINEINFNELEIENYINQSKSLPANQKLNLENMAKKINYNIKLD